MEKVEFIIREKQDASGSIEMKSKNMKSATEYEKKVALQIIIIMSEVIQQTKNMNILPE